ncbi:MAG: archease [Desulfuromonadales bacterium]|nr:archease [Desulfuromonadales bacterium]
MTSPAGHRLIPHTADMGIEAWAGGLEALFVEAGQGLRQMLVGTAPVYAQRTLTVSLTAGDRAELLVAWLNELLFHFEVDGLVPAAFRVDRLDDTCLQAEIGGELFRPERHPLHHQVKAVTYHQLILERRRHGWFARVYVDL